jgi:DNA-binding beta-propeller fold protein YncE
MNLKLNTRSKAILLAAAMAFLTFASTHMRADTGTCGGQMITLPFTDVPSSNIFFCAIAEAYFSGLTNGTTATTYSPSDSVTREQMAAFITRTQDSALTRGSRRAALDQFWTTKSANDFAQTPVGNGPVLVKSDGADLWVVNNLDGTVSRVRASDGRLLETWTAEGGAIGVVVAMGRVFVTINAFPNGKLYMLDPTQSPGAMTLVSNMLGSQPNGIAFDGARVWTANSGGSVSIVNPNPIAVTTITTGFVQPAGVLYDGTNIWVTDKGDNTLKKLDFSGNILQTIAVGIDPLYPAFDGTNIWVPNSASASITVVRASTGVVLSTLNGNGLSDPVAAAFDGQRILVTSGSKVSLWKAADLSPIGSFAIGEGAYGVCSDGVDFWVTLRFNGTGQGKLARF